jgi:hypothetical protein
MDSWKGGFEMTAEMDLFRDYRYRVKVEKPVRTPDDVCKGRHGGNPQSVEANKKPCKDGDRRTILELIKAAPDGRTLKELCEAMGRTPNAISGRITELKMLGRVEVRGVRAGCGVNVCVD